MNSLIVEHAHKFYRLKEQSEKLAKELKEINDEWSQVEAELMEAMVEEGVSSVKVEGAGKFTLASEHYFSATADKKPEVYEFLKTNGHGALIKEEVNVRTLAAFCKNMLTEMTLIEVRNGVPSMEAEQKAIEKMKEIGLSYFRKRTIRTQKG